MNEVDPASRRNWFRAETAMLVCSLAVLTVATVLSICFVNKYSFAFTITKKTVEVTFWPLALLTVIASAFLFFRTMRGLGYSLGTLVLVPLIGSCFLLYHQWPDSVVSVSGWIITTSAALWIAIALNGAWAGIQVWDRWGFLDGVNLAHLAQKEAETKLKLVEAGKADQTSGITALTKKSDELSGQIKEISRARLADSHEAAIREKHFAKWRLYEAQYVGGFLVLVGFRIAEVGHSRPMSINYLQGGRDRELADLVSATAGRFWLIEFKRSEAELKDEFTKETRSRQIAELTQNNSIVALANRCHFIGWGVQRGEIPTLSISRYLDLWENRDQFPPLSLMQSEVFLRLAIPEYNKDAKIGVPASEFQCYLRLLEDWGGSATGEADFATLVMRQDENGNLRFFSEQSFALFMEGWNRACTIEQEQMRRLRPDQDNEGPSHGNGRSHSM